MPRSSVSSGPSKIPYGGVSPVRLQGSVTARSSSAHPSPRTSLMHRKCWTPLRGGGLPLGQLLAGHFGSAFALPGAPLPHGSLAPPGLCCPLASSLLRPDPPVSRTPPTLPLGLRRRPLAHETFPALGHRPVSWCHHPYAGADTDCFGPLPSSAPIGLRPCGNELGCSKPHDPFLVGSRFDAVVFALAAAPRFARPPDGSDRPCRPRGLLPELSPPVVALQGCQVLLRSQTGQLLRRDFHPHGQCRYRLHPAHGLRMASRCAALCSLRVAYGASQAVEPKVVEGLARPALRLSWPQVAPLALKP